MLCGQRSVCADNSFLVQISLRIFMESFWKNLSERSEVFDKISSIRNPQIMFSDKLWKKNFSNRNMFERL